MGVRENKVENHLKDQVEEQLGGISRKWVSPGRVGVPDQIAIIPLSNSEAHALVDKGLIRALVVAPEIKTSDGKVTEPQKREHARLQRAGLDTAVLYGEDDVDAWITKIKKALGRI